MKNMINLLGSQRFYGGIRHNKTSWYWYPSLVEKGSPTRNMETEITAVCAFVAVDTDPGKIVVIRNKRGYDLPGGHVEKNESPLEAVCREVDEEAKAVLDAPQPFMLLSSDLNKNHKTGVLFYKAFGCLKPFTPTLEIPERKILAPEVFLNCYYGNKDLLGFLFSNLEFKGYKFRLNR